MMFPFSKLRSDILEFKFNLKKKRVPENKEIHSEFVLEHKQLLIKCELLTMEEFNTKEIDKSGCALEDFALCYMFEHVRTVQLSGLLSSN